jgi:hypothetical protein
MMTPLHTRKTGVWALKDLSQSDLAREYSRKKTRKRKLIDPRFRTNWGKRVGVRCEVVALKQTDRGRR